MVAYIINILTFTVLIANAADDRFIYSRASVVRTSLGP